MQPVPSSANEVEPSNDLDAARAAAMKAAELVNRNIVGSGYMSTDQKKKLLWGNKKTTAAVDLVAAGVGVKGDLKLEQKPTDKDGSSLFLAEKQEQLQQDLEKQYTAGLRRRDGRTVGLGL
ncbi:hypothetical protein MRB53_008140 [Persea americana]|uniref:Uncharacterized protein n=1 Tax=Persea americana TaxID=3435 RepID=A0ACC2MKV8_PERAE|nr:hypothetical protein MRB53_008140 [Persea americana]